MDNPNKDCYALYIYLINELISIEYYSTYENADEAVKDYFELDKDQILNFDIQKINMS